MGTVQAHSLAFRGKSEVPPYLRFHLPLVICGLKMVGGKFQKYAGLKLQAVRSSALESLAPFLCPTRNKNDSFRPVIHAAHATHAFVTCRGHGCQANRLGITGLKFKEAPRSLPLRRCRAYTVHLTSSSHPGLPRLTHHKRKGECSSVGHFRERSQPRNPHPGAWSSSVRSVRGHHGCPVCLVYKPNVVTGTHVPSFASQ